MFSLSELTKNNISKNIGMPFSDIINLLPEQEVAYVEKKIGGKLIFSKERKKGVFGRGNPLLAKKKLMTQEDADRRSKKFIGI